jgi:hypothetical protein
MSIITCCISLILLASPAINKATPIPDTGQTKCYDNSQEIPCPQPGEPFQGQDAQYGTNTQSYADIGNGIVRDNVTGLEWQQTTAPGTYNWDGALAYCDNLTLGSYSDWRLPTVKELSTLVDSSCPYPGPTINMTYFPNTQASLYWSSTTLAVPPYNDWLVSFQYGYVDGGYNSYGIYVRAVRGEQSTNNFINNGDGTVTDTSTGLMWQQDIAPGTYTWQQALAYCDNLTLGGYSDWRLPTWKELLSIVDYGRYNPSIYTTYFPNTAASFYWSSTTDAKYPDFAWVVYFYSGRVVYGSSKSGLLYIRTVRGVQSGSFSTSTILPTTTTISVLPTTTTFEPTTTIQPTTTTTITPYDEYQDQRIAALETEIAQIKQALQNCGCVPTNISLNELKAIPSDKKVNIQWQTETEPDNAGFNIWRAEGFQKINSSIIPAVGSPVFGSEYDFVDEWVLNGKRYFYLLEDIDTNGISTFHGPVKAIPRWIYGLGK